MTTTRSKSRPVEKIAIIFGLACLLAAIVVGQLRAADAVAQSDSKALPASYFADMALVKQHYNLFDEARALFAEAIARAQNDQDKTDYQIRLAETLDEAGAVADAGTLWKTLSESRTPAVAYRARVAIASKLTDDGKIPEAAAVLEEIAANSPIQAYRAAAARQLAKIVDKAAKLPEYKRRLANEPKNKELLNLILSLQENDAAGRNETLALVYNANPRDLEIMQRYGQSLVDAGKIDDAQKYFTEMRTNYPSLNRDACVQLAGLSMRKGNAAAAADLIAQSAAEMPDDIQKSLYLTREYLAKGLFELAEKHGREADARARGEAMKAAVAMELGDALYHLKKFDEALALLKPVAEQSLWHGLQKRAQDTVAGIAIQVSQARQ